MAILYSSSNVKLFSWGVDTDIDPNVFLELGDVAAVTFGVYMAQGSPPFTSIVNAKLAIWGATPSQGTLPDYPVLLTADVGDLAASGNVASITNGLQEARGSFTVINPPARIRVEFSASTFPASLTGASIQCVASWRH